MQSAGGPVGAENSISPLTRISAEPTASLPTLGATESRTRIAWQASTRPPNTSSLDGALDEIFEVFGTHNIVPGGRPDGIFGTDTHVIG